MKLIAKQPCSFGGNKYYIGDEIPAEHVLDPRAQEKMNVLAIVPDESVDAPPAAPGEVRIEVNTMSVVVRAKDGDMALDLTKEGLQSVVDVLIGKPSEAEAIIGKMTDSDALILVHAADSRKAVKEAAAARAQAISTEESAGDQ